MKIRKGLLSKLIYGAVGIAGIWSLYQLAMGSIALGSMPWWDSASIILLTIGGINWGIVAVTGKSLFEIFHI